MVKTETYILPEYWAVALINGDTSGMTDDGEKSLEEFTDHMIAEHGQCWAMSCDNDVGFMRYHDAEPFGVLACECLEYVFDVTPQKTTA
tara:strand:- start:334 stop:600 length:267 start_codon:yes stop_codon:yes gene_type:complete